MSFTLSYWTILLLSVFAVYGLPKIRLSDIQYSFPFYTREMWGALPALGNTPIVTPVPFVVIHHTAIPGACNTTKQCITDMRSMQKYHIQHMQWNDIGYNFCVGSEGTGFEGQGWQNVGIHAGNANRFSIGICLIGDWRVEIPPALQLETTKELIAFGLRLRIISPDYKLIGHNQATSTECPGEALVNEISQWENYQPGHVDFKKFLKNSANKI